MRSARNDTTTEFISCTVVYMLLIALDMYKQREQGFTCDIDERISWFIQMFVPTKSTEIYSAFGHMVSRTEKRWREHYLLSVWPKPTSG